MLGLMDSVHLGVAVILTEELRGKQGSSYERFPAKRYMELMGEIPYPRVMTTHTEMLPKQ